ncbi:MAG TPA: response regulator [Gemmatimonadaceae bacterium]|nr:response regulator [Gemmatimonadaceae bacterium]
MSPTALIIDDEAPIRRAVKNAVLSEIDRAIEAGTGRDGIDQAAAARPQLIILDLGLPDMDGLDVCREIRKWSSVPIIVLSARHSDAEKVALLDAGADDYMTKPFSTTELTARVRAQMRRSLVPATEAQHTPLVVGTLRIDLLKPSVTRNGEDVHLTRTEWELLRTLLRHAGRTLTHRQLFLAVWGDVSGDAQQYLRVHVRSLRQKLESDPVRPSLIVTEPGVGYRFDPIP